MRFSINVTIFPSRSAGEPTLTLATPVSLTRTPAPKLQIVHNSILGIPSGSEIGTFQIHHPLPYAPAFIASKLCFQNCFDTGV
jgi:hypothetical protein